MENDRREYLKSLQKTHKRRYFSLAHPLLSLHPAALPMASGDPAELARAYDRSREVIAARVKEGLPVAAVLRGETAVRSEFVEDLGEDTYSAEELNG